MRIRLLVWILAPAVTVAAARAETPGAKIGGVVTSAATGEPLNSVQVVLSFPESSESPRSIASTGPTGEFLFTHLFPGSYRLELRRAGYRPLRDGETEIFLDSGVAVVNRIFPLTPTASATGRVAGPDGAAISRAEVRAYAMHYFSGRPRLSYTGRARTDDRGEYRLYGLAAGKYILRVSPPTTGPGRAFYADAAGSYYPNASAASGATPVTLRWGEEASALDIEIPDRLTYFVTGIASDARSGSPCAGCRVSVIRLDGEFALTLQMTASSLTA